MSSTIAPETPQSTSHDNQDATRRDNWLNRNVLGMGLTSLLADLSYETATTVLPMLLQTLGAPAYALGLMEGLADALSSFTKMVSGWLSDQLPRRKPLVVFGYTTTALATGAIAFATLWPVIVALRALAWIGKGLRSPARNALLADSVPATDRGKAFGFHRSGDTIGAILGPLVAAWLIGSMGEVAVRQVTIFQDILLWTLVPGIGAALVMGLVVRETIRGAIKARKPIGVSLSQLPRSYRRFLVAVGIFGAGDFSHTLLILAATQLLAPSYGFIEAAQWGAILFAIRNAAAALAAFPIGWLSDRIGRQSLLVAGYFLSALATACLALMFAADYADVVTFAALFVAAGIVNATQESLEGALTADFVPDADVRGTAYGLLGAVNGVGDFVASLTVGLLWTAMPVLGLAYAATMMGVGTCVLAYACDSDSMSNSRDDGTSAVDSSP